MTKRARHRAPENGDRRARDVGAARPQLRRRVERNLTRRRRSSRRRRDENHRAHAVHCRTNDSRSRSRHAPGYRRIPSRSRGKSHPRRGDFAPADRGTTRHVRFNSLTLRGGRMNRVVTSRVATLMTAAIVVVIAACSDANGSQPGLTGPNASTSSRRIAGDSAKNTPGNPGGGHPDTSITTTPGSEARRQLHARRPRRLAASRRHRYPGHRSRSPAPPSPSTKRRTPSPRTPARTPSTSTRRWLAAACQTQTANSPFRISRAPASI